MTRRGLLHSPLLAFLAAPLTALLGRRAKPEREPWIANALHGYEVVRTAAGEFAWHRNPKTGHREPLLSYEVTATLDGEPCFCSYADEAAGFVLCRDAQDPDTFHKRTGVVRLRVE